MHLFHLKRMLSITRKNLFGDDGISMSECGAGWKKPNTLSSHIRVAYIYKLIAAAPGSYHNRYIGSLMPFHCKSVLDIDFNGENIILLCCCFAIINKNYDINSVRLHRRVYMCSLTHRTEEKERNEHGEHFVWSLEQDKRNTSFACCCLRALSKWSARIKWNVLRGSRWCFEIILYVLHFSVLCH